MAYEQKINISIIRKKKTMVRTAIARIVGIFILALLVPQVAHAQKAAVKTNLLYGVYTRTPNLGMEFALGDRHTLDLGGGYNPWNWKGSPGDNKKLVHWLAQAEYRYEGWGAGGGISYGYSFYLGKRWSLEANIGVGYVRLHYDKYDCVKCGEKVGTESRNYFGPTKAGISLIYIIK